MKSRTILRLHYGFKGQTSWQVLFYFLIAKDPVYNCSDGDSLKEDTFSLECLKFYGSFFCFIVLQTSKILHCCFLSGSEGVVEDAILLGAPVDGSEKAWERMTRVVAGKIVNGYCRSSEAAALALLWLYNYNCRKHWPIDCLFVNPSTNQRGLAPGILVPKFRRPAVCCWVTASQCSGSTNRQRGSLLRGESQSVGACWRFLECDWVTLSEGFFFHPKTLKGKFVIKFNSWDAT